MAQAERRQSPPSVSLPSEPISSPPPFPRAIRRRWPVVTERTDQAERSRLFPFMDPGATPAWIRAGVESAEFPVKSSLRGTCLDGGVVTDEQGSVDREHRSHALPVAHPRADLLVR